MNDERAIERARQLAREKALYRYSSALARGDFEVVVAVLAEAEQDPLLERMLLEMNEVYREETQRLSAAVDGAVEPAEDAAGRWSLARLFRRTRRRGEGRKVGPSGRARGKISGRPRWVRALVTAGIVFGVLLTLLVGLASYAGRYDRQVATSAEDTRLRITLGLDRPWYERFVPLRGGRDDTTYLAPYYFDSDIEATDSAPAQPDDRLIVRSGNISMVVEDTQAARQSIEQMVAEMAAEGAFVVSSNEYSSTEDGSPRIVMTIRVPEGRFAEAMDRLADLAVEVTARDESAQDVTEEYVDLGARLESLEAARQRLLEIMQEAQTTEDLLRAEQQLTQREAEIESIKGRMQYLEQSAQLAGIQIDLLPYILSQPVSANWRPAETVRQAFGTLVDGLRGLGDFLIYFSIAVLPWVVALVLLVYGLVRLVGWRVRLRRQKRAS